MEQEKMERELEHVRELEKLAEDMERR